MNKNFRISALLIAACLMVSACSSTKPQGAAPAVSAAPSASPAVPPATPAGPSASAASPAASSPQPSSEQSAKPAAADLKPAAGATAAATAKPEDKPSAAPTTKPSVKPDPTPTPKPTAPPQASAKPAAADASAQAETLYKDNCMACHAAGLQGGFGPDLQKVGSRKTKEQIVRQIENGGGDMPGFAGQLSKEQVDTLATWLSGKK